VSIGLVEIQSPKVAPAPVCPQIGFLLFPYEPVTIGRHRRLADPGHGDEIERAQRPGSGPGRHQQDDQQERHPYAGRPTKP